MAAAITWLGTGNFSAPLGRYWNGFVVEATVSGRPVTVLVELPPSTLPNLRRASIGLDRIDVVAVSHFHPDHTFGWPFLLFELLPFGRRRPLTIVGPPGIRSYLEQMMRLGSMGAAHERAHDELDITYVEVADGARREVGALGLPVRAVLVEHVPELECFGYVFELDGHRLGYSGDTTPCPGLDRLGEASDTLVVECNGIHPARSHMDVESVRALGARFPALRIVATHLGGDVTADMLPGVLLPDDLSRVELGR